LIYSQQARILFTHISRTGGVTITESLREQLPDITNILGQHDSLVMARSELGKTHFQEAFKFAIVRNPWDRLMSWYTLIGKSTQIDEDEILDPESKYWKLFDSFLEKWSSEKIIIDGVKRRKLSQWAQLVDAEGQLLTNQIGRFETYQQDNEQIFKKINLKFNHNVKFNSSKHLHYSLYYSNFGRELVESLFHEDVNHFEYHFNKI
jgi:hypothetical protein